MSKMSKNFQTSKFQKTKILSVIWICNLFYFVQKSSKIFKKMSEFYLILFVKRVNKFSFLTFNSWENGKLDKKT